MAPFFVKRLAVTAGACSLMLVPIVKIEQAADGPRWAFFVLGALAGVLSGRFADWCLDQ